MSYKHTLTLVLMIFLPNYIYCQSPPRNTEDFRLQRLNTLAVIWGDLAIHHSKLVGKEKYWDSVLTASIPLVEKAPLKEDFVRILNSTLFSALDDPFSHAFIFNQIQDTSSIHINRNRFTVLKLDQKVGYVAVPPPADYTPNNDYGKFIKELYKSILSLGPVEQLIIDLRTISKNSYYPATLSFWAEKEIYIGPTITPFYWYYL